MPLHPEFLRRHDALTLAARDEGIYVGTTSICRTLAQQIRLYNQKPRYAANPYAVGSVTPWGWRYRGSLHMEQVDGYCHAIDYVIVGCTWPRFHELAHSFGIGFPVVSERKYEPWHAQWFHGATFYEQTVFDWPTPEPPWQPQLFNQEGDMYEFVPRPRPTAPNTLDFTWLPGEGEAFGVRVLSKLYVRRQHALAQPDHIRVWMGGVMLDRDDGADDSGLYWLPEDGQPIELAVRAGFCSVEGVGGQPVAVAQYQTWYVGA